ncbi:MAG: carboxypeptidase regulatory-like domain-containing protein, partial [Candidatus Muiribacteriota bacterium]
MKFKITILLLIILAGLIQARTFITGNITDEGGKPISDVKIILGSYSENNLYKNPLITFTDKNGRYRFNDIIPGLQSIEAEKMLYSITGDTIVIKNGSNIYNMKLRQENSDIDFDRFKNLESRLARFTLSGKLTDSVTGDGIINAYVVFGKEITRSDSNGNFIIEAKDNSEAELIIKADNYEIYQERVRPKTNTRIKMDLKVPYNEIFGQVIAREDLAGIPGIEVFIGSTSVKTDNRGNYFLKNLPSAEYPIRVDDYRYRPYSDVVKIYRGKQNYDIILREKEKFGYVFGYVKKRSNLTPASNVLVAIGTISIRTDEHGFYELHGVRAEN